MRLMALVEDYIASALLRPRSADNYREVGHVLCEHFRCDPLIADIHERNMLEFRTAVLARARPQSYNSYRRHLAVLMNYAIRRGYIQESPLRNVRSAPTGKTLPKTVDVEVLATAIAKLDAGSINLCGMGPAWFWVGVLRTLRYSGMRRRQIVCLQWKDIDLAKKTIRLCTDGSKTHREWEIPLATKLERDVRCLRERTETMLGNPPNLSAQVFRWPLFAPRPQRLKQPNMTVWQFDHFFKRLSEAMGTRISSHRIRHTTATQLANRTPNLRDVQELLGHTDIRTTMLYVHPDLRQMRWLVDQLGDEPSPIQLD